MLKTLVYISLLLIISGITHFAAGQGYSLASPDKKYLVTVGVNAPGQLQYQISYEKKTIITPSSLNLAIGDNLLTGSHVSIISKKDTTVDYTWKPVYGERNMYRNHYRQMTVFLQGQQGCMLQVVFRAYNEGIAFKYIISGSDKHQDTLTIHKELTAFSLPGDAEAWVTYSAQGVYKKMPVEKIEHPAERPLVIQEDNGLYLAIGEAALIDYTRMRLMLSPDKKNTLVSVLSGEVRLPLPAATPWRFVMAYTSPGQLVAHNYLLLNLNKPRALNDVSWIKPGKVIREVTLTSQGGKACIDFAAKHNLQYIEYDAGWYGPEYKDTSDATTVTLDPRRSKGPLDLKEVIRYGREKGIGIILYVNRRALEKQLDEILPLYQSWGIKGVKYGFVRVGSQRWTSWLHEAIRKAARHHLMVDIHDEFRPTGYTRTYPNFMTCEGIRGDEESPSNTHTLITMFTRMIAGPADNTVCYYSKRVDEKMGSHASQLAKTVCIYSPWQFLYWYDRPEGSPGSKKLRNEGGERLTGNEPELEFFDHVPTVWDDTRVIEGEPGKYGTMARRHGTEWYIGSINGVEPHTVKIPLDFLTRKIKYTAFIYSDDPHVNTRTHVKIETRMVNKQNTLIFDLKPNNGLAIRITPTKDKI